MTARGRQRKLPRVDSMTAIASEPEVPFASGTGPRTVARDPRKLALSDRWRRWSVFWRNRPACSAIAVQVLRRSRTCEWRFVSRLRLFAIARPRWLQNNGGNSSPFGTRGEPLRGQGEALRAIGRRFAPREAASQPGHPLRGDGDHVQSRRMPFRAHAPLKTHTVAACAGVARAYSPIDGCFAGGRFSTTLCCANGGIDAESVEDALRAEDRAVRTTSRFRACSA